MHLLDLRAGRQRRTHRLRWYGRGKGRGLMPFGLAGAADGSLYFAEYVTEPGDRSTGVWRSRDSGERWELAFEFEPGQVRHIHTVHADGDGSLWIGTGDRDEQCFVGRSADGGSTSSGSGTARRSIARARSSGSTTWCCGRPTPTSSRTTWCAGSAGPAR